MMNKLQAFEVIEKCRMTDKRKTILKTEWEKGNPHARFTVLGLARKQTQ